MSQPKYTQIGQVLKSKKGKDYIRLGNPNAKSDKYKYDVKVMVTDSAGNKTMMVNPSIFLFDPRQGKNGETKTVPDYILRDLVFIEDSETKE